MSADLDEALRRAAHFAGVTIDVDDKSAMQAIFCALRYLRGAGWELMPRQANQAMVDAHQEECAGDAGEAGPDRIRSCWQAMLAAAPKIEELT